MVGGMALASPVTVKALPADVLVPAIWSIQRVPESTVVELNIKGVAQV